MNIQYDHVSLGLAHKLLLQSTCDMLNSNLHRDVERLRAVVERQSRMTLELRSRTGATLLVCRAALVRTEWDLEKAVFQAGIIEARAA